MLLWQHTTKDYGKINRESWQFLSDVVYFYHQKLGKVSYAYSVFLCPRSLSKARYFDRSRWYQWIPFHSVGSQRHTDSRSTADFQISGNFSCFFIDCSGMTRCEHFMSWLLYNRGTGATVVSIPFLCSVPRRHNKLMKRSIRVVKVHLASSERTVTI